MRRTQCLQEERSDELVHMHCPARIPLEELRVIGVVLCPGNAQILYLPVPRCKRPRVGAVTVVFPSPMCTSAPVCSRPRLANTAFKSVCALERSFTSNPTKLNFDRLRARFGLRKTALYSTACVFESSERQTFALRL